jgi:glutaredoxin 3
MGFLSRGKKDKSGAAGPAADASGAARIGSAPGAAPGADDRGTGSEPIRVYSMGPSQELRYALELLSGKGLAFEEIDVSANPALQSWVKQATGSNEYPQVFLGRRSLGDFGAIRELDLHGNLDRVLAGLPPVAVYVEEQEAGSTEVERVRARLRLGDTLSLTTPEGETFDVWAEIFANPPQVYYRGEPRPIGELEDIVREIIGYLADPQTDAAWSGGR